MDQDVAFSSSKPSNKVQLICDCGCGSPFYRYPFHVNDGGNYLNHQHMGAAIRQKNLQERCGPYLSLVEGYLNGPAQQRYRDTSDVRNHISPFFQYLCEHAIESLQQVIPATVTAFQLWAQDNGYRSASRDTSALSIFFQWAIFEEHYEGESPVIPSIHGKREKPRSGRPYSLLEMTEMRQLLDERGNERLRAFFEIASESGMRREEICRLRLEDVAIDSRTLKVSLPNKTMRERNAFFSDRATVRIHKWLAVRNKDCGHDFLFHNYYRNPLRGDAIGNEFTRTLCKTFKGEVVNETGLNAFSIHRLRHTLTSNLASAGAHANTQMTVLGWVSEDSADGYTKLDEHAKMAGFATAMDKVEQQASEGLYTRVLTAREFLLLAGKTA